MSTFDRVKKVLVEQLDVDEDAVTPAASIVDDLGADSLDVVEIIMGLEEEFDVEIPTKTPRRSRPSSRSSVTWRRRAKPDAAPISSLPSPMAL